MHTIERTSGVQGWPVVVGFAAGIAAYFLLQGRLIGVEQRMHMLTRRLLGCASLPVGCIGIMCAMVLLGFGAPWAGAVVAFVAMFAFHFCWGQFCRAVFRRK